MIVENSDRFLDMLGNIDLRTSEATNPVDKERIFQVVEKTVGLATLNIKVAEVMKAWVERRLHSLSRIGWDWSDIPQFLGGELNFFSNKDDAADHSFKITVDKVSYCLSYASILIANGKYTIAEREIGRIKSAINSAEWAEKSQLEGEAKIVEAKLILHTNENRTPEKFTPILFRKIIPMFKTADINRTMELFSEGIAIFDKLLNDVESGSSRSDKLISLYLKSYDGKCAVLLKSRDLKEEVVLEYYEKAVKLTGEESLETAVAMATKASFYQHNNDPIKAIECYEKALRNYHFFVSDSHPTTIRLSFQIAMIYNELAKFSYHQKLLEEVYFKTLEKFPPKSEFTTKVGTSYFIASTLTCRWYTMYKYQKSTMKLFLFNEIEQVWKTFRNQKLTIRNCLAKFVVCICLLILLMIALFINVAMGFYFFLLFLQLAPLIIMRASLHKLLSFCLTPTCLVRVMYGRRGKSIVLQFIFTFTFPIVMFLAFVIALPIALLFQIIKACGSSLARIK